MVVLIIVLPPGLPVANNGTPFLATMTGVMLDSILCSGLI